MPYVIADGSLTMSLFFFISLISFLISLMRPMGLMSPMGKLMVNRQFSIFNRQWSIVLHIKLIRSAIFEVFYYCVEAGATRALWDWYCIDVELYCYHTAFVMLAHLLGDVKHDG